jgi:hypothetical protein
MFGHKENVHYNFLLFSDEENDFKIVETYKTTNYVNPEDGSSGLSIIPYQGETIFSLLLNNRIVFTHTGVDKEYREKDYEYYYRLHISDFDGRNRVEIDKIFNPIILPLNQLFHKTKIGRDLLKEYPYHPTLQDIKADRNFIFAFTYKKNEENEILTDIFDANSGKYLKSVYFPFIPYCIVNNKMYYMKTPPFIPRNWRNNKRIPEDIKKVFEEFEKNPYLPKIEVYKLDPVVYK